MTQYVVDNDPYVASGYSDTEYVGPDADLLYVASGYVSGVTLGTASFSASASVSADALTLIRAESSISAAASFGVTETRIRPFSSSINGSGSVSANGVATKVSTASLGGDGGAVIAASATVRPGLDLTVAATMTTVANPIKNFSASLEAGTADVLWSDPYTWNWPDVIWGPALVIDPTLTVSGVASISASASIEIDAVKTARIEITVPGAGLVVSDADVIKAGTATLSSAASVSSAAAITGNVVNFTMSANAQVSARGTYQIKGVMSATVSATIDTEYTRLRRHTKQLDGVATLPAVDYIRFRSTGTSITSTAAMTVDADRVGRGTILKAGSATLTSDALRGRGFVDYEIIGQASLYCLGGRLVGFAEELITESIASVRGNLFKFVIDPYRVYTIKTEGRTLEIVQETRKNTLKSENRLNTIPAETRSSTVASETRKLEVENLTFTDVFGPIDRRE
jgi:hypothetical protein